MIDTLVISGPLNSLEPGGLVKGPTKDHQNIWSLFHATARAARIPPGDSAFASERDAVRERIAPNQIGRLKHLQEGLEDRDDSNDRHRHVSHRWGVFSGEDTSWRTPEPMQAARTSPDLRGEGQTGWSLRWQISLRNVLRHKR